MDESCTVLSADVMTVAPVIRLTGLPHSTGTQETNEIMLIVVIYERQKQQVKVVLKTYVKAGWVPSIQRQTLSSSLSVSPIQKYPFPWTCFLSHFWTRIMTDVNKFIFIIANVSCKEWNQVHLFFSVIDDQQGSRQWFTRCLSTIKVVQVLGEKVAFVPVIQPLMRTTCKTMISVNIAKFTLLSVLIDYGLQWYRHTKNRYQTDCFSYIRRVQTRHFYTSTALCCPGWHQLWLFCVLRINFFDCGLCD